MGQNRLLPDLKEARRFLNLFDEGLFHTFQWFPEVKALGGPAAHKEGDLDDMAAMLTAINNERCGIFFTVNETDGKGRDTGNIVSVRALFVDLDGAPLEPVLAAGVDPHAVVCSSPGKFQVYWLVKDCPLDRFTPLQLALAEKFKSDPQVADLPRVMRVPGFWHQKKDPHLVRVDHIEYFMPYPVEVLVERFGLADLEREAVQKQALPPLSELYQQKIPEGERHKKLMRYAAKFAYEGKTPDEVYGLVQSINFICCSSPKPEKEIRDIVQAAFNYAGPPGGGYIPPAEEREEDSAATELALPEAFVIGAPGLVGQVADWINGSITREQPHFALAAALSFVGVLKGHRVQTPRRSRTNHMTLAIGKSGSGKSEVGSRIEDLIRCAGLDHIIMGIPASDSGLRAGMAHRRGRVFIFWDEMGLALEGMLQKNSQYHIRAIKDLFVEVWTKAHTVLRKKELITVEAQKAHVDIQQPCFGFYATAQPDIFYGALSSAHAADGFFPRLLVFETRNNYPPERAVTYTDPPDLLVDSCRDIESWPTNCTPGSGNLSDMVINPRVVPFSPAAQKLLDAAKKDIERKLDRTGDSLTGGVWARSLSHIEKIALTVEDRPVISRESAEWAIDLVMRLSAAMSAAFKLRVSDSAIEKTKKRVLQVIAAAGVDGIGTNLLTRKTQFLRDKRERDAVLCELEHSGQVTTIMENTAGRSTKKWILVEHASAQKSNTVNPSVKIRQSTD
jgi:hypothetical protein